MGFERTLAQFCFVCFCFPHNFHGFEKMSEESKRGLQQLNGPQREAGTKSARRWLQWTPLLCNINLLWRRCIYNNTNKNIWWNWRSGKVKEKQEEGEVAEEPDIHDRKRHGVFLYLRRHCFFKAYDMKVKWFTKVATAIRNAIQSYHVIQCWGKRDTT